MDNRKKEIVITGFGGQGIVLAGKIVGKAAALGDKMESTLIQSYGPESRGGACSAQVIIAATTIDYPYVRKPHILAAMSQAGFEKFIDQVQDDGLVLIDQDLVKPRGVDREIFAVPATRMAEELGRKMMANIIMVGFFTAITGAISKEAAEKTVEGSVPRGTEQMNLNAFNKGHDFGVALLRGKDRKATGRARATA
ncbi:MAG: 2-oxoacid:acceptor oxidoreductase family protein [Desulfatibacillaceae bacterium]